MYRTLNKREAYPTNKLTLFDPKRVRNVFRSTNNLSHIRSQDERTWRDPS